MSANKEYGKKVIEFLAFKSSSPKMKKLKASEGNQETSKKAGGEKGDSLRDAPTTSTETNPQTNKRDVIIIGAGLSGK